MSHGKQLPGVRRLAPERTRALRPPPHERADDPVPAGRCRRAAEKTGGKFTSSCCSGLNLTLPVSSRCRGPRVRSLTTKLWPLVLVEAAGDIVAAVVVLLLCDDAMTAGRASRSLWCFVRPKTSNEKTDDDGAQFSRFLRRSVTSQEDSSITRGTKKVRGLSGTRCQGSWLPPAQGRPTAAPSTS